MGSAKMLPISLIWRGRFWHTYPAAFAQAQLGPIVRKVTENIYA
jgi:hypothetical protein